MSRMVAEKGGRSKGGFCKEARPIRVCCSANVGTDFLYVIQVVLQQWRRAVSRRAASSRGYIRARHVCACGRMLRMQLDVCESEAGRHSRCFEIRRVRAFRRETRARPRCSAKVTSWLRSESARNVKRACVISRAISTLRSSRIIYEGCNGVAFNLSRDYNSFNLKHWIIINLRFECFWNFLVAAIRVRFKDEEGEVFNWIRIFFQWSN